MWVGVLGLSSATQRGPRTCRAAQGSVDNHLLACEAPEDHDTGIKEREKSGRQCQNTNYNLYTEYSHLSLDQHPKQELILGKCMQTFILGLGNINS